MTYVRIGGSSFSNEDIFAFVVVILVIGIASWIGYFILKSKDNSKPLEKAKVKILEKPVQKGNIEKIAVARGHEIVSIIDVDNRQDFASEAFRRQARSSRQP